MICWVKHTGMVGGYPVKVTTYWEGLYKSKTMFWITPLSNREWHLVSAGNNNKFSMRDKDCNKLKDAGVAQMVEQLICNQQVTGSIPVTSSI